MSTLNNGLKSFYLDGKPVRRASLGGKIFYEKHDYELSLVSDMDIVSLYDGDIATLTATLTDYGEPVSGETCFICDSNVEFIKHTAPNRSRISLKCDGDGTITLATNCDFTVYDSDGNPLYYGHISAGTTTWTLSGTTLTASNWAPRTRELPSNGFILEVLMYDDINNAVSNDSYNHLYYFGVTDSNGECSVSYESKGAGDLNIKCRVPHRSLVTEIYVEDCIFYNDEEVTVATDTLYLSDIAPINQDFILTFDYRASDYWEWTRFYLDIDLYFTSGAGAPTVFMFSSSYDKGSFPGFTNLGYNVWRSLTIKREGNLATAYYNNQTVTKDVSNDPYPVTPILFPNRNNTKFKNVKLKLLRL